MCCFVFTSFHHPQLLFRFLLGGGGTIFNTIQLLINRIQEKLGMFVFCIVNMFHKVFIHS